MPWHEVISVTFALPSNIRSPLSLLDKGTKVETFTLLTFLRRSEAAHDLAIL